MPDSTKKKSMYSSTTQLLLKEKPKLTHDANEKFETVFFLPVEKNRKGEGGLRTNGYFKKSYPLKPLVSIITVVFNGKKFLEETIVSVINQTYDNIEYILIDGGSSDGTVDIIKKYEDKIDYWISEKDCGIYDAMNKGLTLCCGNYIGILNADDYYTNDIVSKSVNDLLLSQKDYCIANVKFVKSSAIIKPIVPLKKKFVYQEMPYPHVGAFISLKCYKNIGLFDVSFKIAGDFDMAMRIHLYGYEPIYVDTVAAQLEDGGVSSSSQTFVEFKNVAIKYGKNRLLADFTYIVQSSKMVLIKFLPREVISFIQKIKNSRFI